MSTFPGLPVTTYLSPTLSGLRIEMSLFHMHVFISPLDVDRTKGTEGQVGRHMLQNYSLQHKSHVYFLPLSLIEKSLSIH